MKNIKKVLSVCLAILLMSAGLSIQVFAENETAGNTYNGETIPFSDWENVGEGNWYEEGGVITSAGDAEWLLLQYTKPITGNYVIEFDVKQHDANKNLQIMIGFEVNKGENFTTSGLTFEMHNAGIARMYDTAINRQNEAAYGGCNNSYGGHQTYSGTTEWIHVTIKRMENNFTVEYNDGLSHLIECTLEDYNGGHLVLGANPSREISYKNITIMDNLEMEVSVEEPGYPEKIGDTEYIFNGNKYDEWKADGDTWSVNGEDYIQNSTEEGEKIAYLDSEELRNFSLTLSYEVLSEQEGFFGIGFRKSKAESSYQGLGYALLFKCTAEANGMTVIDYLNKGDAGLDGLVHEFELAGTVEISCSGNEIYVWMNDTLIANIKDNAYASGTIALFTSGCSVEFSDLMIISDDLLSDDAQTIINTAETLADGDVQSAKDALAIYESLNDFQKSIFPDAVKTKLDTVAKDVSDVSNDLQTREENGNEFTVWYIIAGVVVLAAIVILVIVIIKNKKTKE